MRPTWTIEERMLLHHLFALIGYLPKNDDWWRIYEDIQHPTRGRTVIYEDWKYGGGKKRGGMWETQIRIPFNQYNDAQRTAFSQSRAAIDAALTRLNITLPNNPVAHNAQTANAADLLATRATANSSNSLPVTASTSSGNTAGGSNTSTTQTSKATSKSKRRNAPATPSAAGPSATVKDSAEEPQKTPARSRRRKQASASYEESFEESSFESEDGKGRDDGPLRGAQSPVHYGDSDGSEIVIASRAPLGSDQPKTGDKDANTATQTYKQTYNEGVPQSEDHEHQKRVSTHVGDYGQSDHDFSVVGDSKRSDPGTSKSETEGKQIQKEDIKAQEASVANDDLQTARDKSEAELSDEMETSPNEPINENNYSLPPAEEGKLNEMYKTELTKDGNQDLPPAPTNEETSLDDRHRIWRQIALDNILMGNHKNRYPVVEEPYQADEEREAEPEELSGGHRVLNFFMHMFGGHRDKILEVMANEQTPNDQHGKILQLTYNALCRELGTLGVQPKYRLSHVFTSPESPFPNFALAFKAFGQGIQMLHRSQVNFSGIGAKFVVVCGERMVHNDDPAKNTLTARDVSFVDHNDAVFKRGGRVYSVEIHQPSVPILGQERGFNTASVKMEVMLCDAAACAKCSPDSPLDISPTSGMLRVHFRHLGRPGNTFTQVDPNPYGFQNEDSGGEFPDEPPALPDDVQFWDGSVQQVITCIGPRCEGCQEAARLRNEKWGTMADYRERLQQAERDREALARILADQGGAARGRGRGRARGRGRGRGRAGRG